MSGVGHAEPSLKMYREIPPTLTPASSRYPPLPHELWSKEWKKLYSTCTMAVVTSSVEPGGQIAPDVNAILNELAAECGVATWYTGQNGQRVDVKSSTVLFALRELGLDLPEDPAALTEDAVQTAIEDLLRTRYSRMIAPTITAIADRPRTLHVHCIDGESLQVRVRTEDGDTIELEQLNEWVDPITVGAEATATTFGTATFQLPALPAGWHQIEAQAESTEATSTLLVSPQSLELPEAPRAGVMAQLYSLRDKDAWGVGDYETLEVLSNSLQKLGGADFVLVNPMHAAEAAPPVEDSPYLPTTRRYTNPIYIRVENTPEYAAHPELHAEIQQLAEPLKKRNHTAELLERDPVVASKIKALHLLYTAGIGDERTAQLREFREREGEGLVGFTEWCERAANDPALTSDFFAWMQMLCQEQELHAQQTLTEHTSIGLMADLAVGVHPGGADAETLADVLAPGASVGAPPDGYNQQGQDWSQPPWHPWKLAEEGYRPWRDMLRTILRTAGGIRIDHVLGLFRLWWIPRMESPTLGTYVTYDHEALVGALVLEAHRAGAVVVGEDLGTFEPWVQDYLASRGVMGTSIVWFEGDANGAKAPEAYRRTCLTSVTTHDLPPTASYLRGGHIDLREELGVLTRSSDEEFAEDANWQVDVLGTIARHGAFQGMDCEDYFLNDLRQELDDPRHGRERRPDVSYILRAMHRYIAQTPSLLRCAALVDLVGDLRAQNQPGTTQDLYPNWRVPLCDGQGNPVLVEDLPNIQLAREVLSATRGEG